MDERRTLRVSEAVREELTEIIGFELDDPRLLDVDVTEVHVSPDSRHATVKIAARGDETPPVIVPPEAKETEVTFHV